MKPTELKLLRKLVQAGEKRPLSKNDMVLLARIKFALNEYVLHDGKPEVPSVKLSNN